MISIHCTHCRQLLEMDDAFAGGVCRCQYCGTIQTVPSLSKIKRQTSPMASAPAPANVPAPASPQPQAAEPSAQASGLDELAEVVASSSGLGRGSLRSGVSTPAAVAPPDGRPPAPAPAPAAASPVDYARPTQHKKRPVWLLVTGGIVAALVLVALGGAIFSRRTVVSNGGTVPLTPDPHAGKRGNPVPSPDDVAIPPTPHFCGIDLQGEPSVVYVIDCGAATREMFDTLKEAVYRSLESLQANQKFAVIFWSNGGEMARYPEDHLAVASAGETNAAQMKFAEVYAGGRAEPHEAIKAAAALKPGAIVLVTAKADALGEDVIDLTREALAGSHTKVHTVALGSDDGSTVLKRISHSTGGKSIVVTKPQLHGYSE